MEMSGQLHAPAPSPPEKEPHLPVGLEALWAPEPVWKQRRDKSWHAANQTLILREGGRKVAPYILTVYRSFGWKYWSNSTLSILKQRRTIRLTLRSWRWRHIVLLKCSKLLRIIRYYIPEDSTIKDKENNNSNRIFSNEVKSPACLRSMSNNINAHRKSGSETPCIVDLNAVPVLLY
jgi:hypothetical protein